MNRWCTKPRRDRHTLPPRVGESMDIADGVEMGGVPGRSELLLRVSRSIRAIVEANSGHLVGYLLA